VVYEWVRGGRCGGGGVPCCLLQRILSDVLIVVFLLLLLLFVVVCLAGGEFLKAFGNVDEIYMPDPTWGNHAAIFKRCGLAPKTYRYLNRSAQCLDFEGMVEDLKNLPDNSAVLLHACAHNPTGVDPTPEQWAEISSVLKPKGCIPFFDSAYQGFASGDAEKDATAVRTFVDDGHPVMTTQSFSKNFGLYSDRVGCLSLICKDEEEGTWWWLLLCHLWSLRLRVRVRRLSTTLTF